MDADKMDANKGVRRVSDVRRVVEFDGQAWVVRSASGELASLRTSDRGTAVARAKEIVRHLGGGQVEVREKDSRVGTVSMVPPPSRRRRRR
jgi:hypothetical protein